MPFRIPTTLLLTVALLSACDRRSHSVVPAPAADKSAQSPVAASKSGALPLTPVSYDRDIRPILSDKCFYCHGPDEKKRDSGLRLDHPEMAHKALAKSGHIPFVPGKPEASEAFRRATTTDQDDVMPPVKSGKAKLTADEAALLARWIKEGATYATHWSFEAPVKSPLPEVSNSAWCRNEVDRFVLANLEEKGLSPSPQADKETLLRRVSLDLTGLPPTPQEYDAFIKDTSEDAYEKQVKRLLDSPRLGERIASYWCDAARYADTVGMHADEYHDYYRWRDWMIQSINKNMPYDQFLTNCLAGDLVDKPTDENRLGSIFVRLNPVSSEGGAIEEELRVEYAADRVDVLGTSLLGVSLRCARCHDHKFDPISQEDYFSVFAYFNSLDETGLTDRNNAIFGASFVLSSDVIEKERALRQENIKEFKAAYEKAVAMPVEKPDFASWRAQAGRDVLWANAAVESAQATAGVRVAVEANGAVLSSGEVPDKSVVSVVLRTDATKLNVLRLDALPHPSFPGGSVGRAAGGNAALSYIEAEAVSVRNPSLRKPVKFVSAFADYEQVGGDYDVLNALRPDPSAWALGGNQKKEPRVAYFVANEPFGFEGGTQIKVKLHYESYYEKHEIGQVKLDVASAKAQSCQAIASAWLTSEPLRSSYYQGAFDGKFAPESSLDLSEQLLKHGVNWKRQTEYVNGVEYELEGKNTTQYLTKVLFLDQETPVALDLTSDQGVKIWLDGALVATQPQPEGKATLRVAKSLSAGTHVLMMKLVNPQDTGHFTFNLSGVQRPFDGAALALTPEAAMSEVQKSALLASYSHGYCTQITEARIRLKEAEKMLAAFDGRRPRALTAREAAKPRDTFVLMRGEYDKPDKKRPVSPHPLRIGGISTEKMPKNRLGLAQWMTHPANPLVGRTMINRYWQMLFVHGLCKTSEDVGLQGEYPINLPLLDHLAVLFREEGWDVKKTLYRLVTSATYRQESVVRADAKKIDPDNRLLAYFPRQRLTAEAVRDQALAISGLLVEKIGGRPVKPYQPGGLWEALALRGSPLSNYVQDHGEDLYRRSIYTFWKRATTPSQMVIFDGLDRGSCAVRRPTTNTPMQALMLWNDPQFVEAARVFATHLLEETSSEDEALTDAFRRCTGRVPTAVDLAPLQKLLAAAKQRYAGADQDARALLKESGEWPLPTKGKASDPATLATWTMLCSTLLSLDETIVRD